MAIRLFKSMSTRFSVVTVVILIVIYSLSAIMSIINDYLALEKSMQSKGISLMRTLAFVAGEAMVLDDRDRVQRMLDNCATDEDIMFISLESLDGRVLLSTDSARIDAVSVDDGIVITESSAEDTVIRRSIDSVTGHETLMVIRFLGRNQPYRLRLVMTRVPPRESILTTYQYYLSKVLIIGLLGILISVIISQKITNPLRILVGDVQKIAAGDLSMRVTRTSGDEIGQLAAAFEDMRISLRHKIGELDAMITELTSVHGLGTAINSELDQDRLQNMIVQSVARGLNFDKVLLLLVSEDDACIHYGQGYGIDERCEKDLRIQRISLHTTTGATVLTEILKDGLTVVQNPAHMTRQGYDALLINCFGERPFVVQPLIAQGRGIGLLLVCREHRRELPGEREKDSLRNLANHASVALENARMYQQSFERARIEEELRHARELQIAYRQLEERNELLQRTMHELKDAQEELLSTSRLAALGELAGRVAHEVLNPITAIVTRIDRMLDHYLQQGPPPEQYLDDIIADWQAEYTKSGSLDAWLSKPVEQGEGTYGEEDFRTLHDIGRVLRERMVKTREDLEFLRFHTFRVIKIVDSLRAMSRTSPGSEDIAINDVLHASVELMIDGFTKRNISVREEYGHDLPHIRANYSEMIQVFSNLLKNSMQAIEESQRSGGITVSTSFSEGTVEVRIIDDGIGITSENFSRVFDPDFSTKSREEGTGLGLSLSRRFVREIGGEIVIEASERNRGTTVLVTIPVRQETEIPPAESLGNMERLNGEAT